MTGPTGPSGVGPSGPAEVAAAVEVLRAGGLVAFPTETVYGLGADASSPGAVERVFAVKGRPRDHPLIVHLGHPSQLGAWSDDPGPAAHRLAEACWPGPLTLIVRRSARVAGAVTGGRPTVGLRVPDHPVALALLGAFGGGVAAPSANRFGRVSPTTAAHVRADLGADVDVVLDGGPSRVGVESTIVDLTGEAPEVLRPGGTTLERLEEVLGRPVARWDGRREVAAPGTLASHYAPAARLELVAAPDVAARAAAVLAEGGVPGVLGIEPVAGLPPGVVALGPVGSVEGYARLLYDRLRQADADGVDVLLAVPPPPRGLGAAVLDRLARAAAR